EIHHWTKGEGANVVIDAVGLPSTVEQAISVTSVAARVVLLGFDTRLSSLAQVTITKKELTICGSRLQTHRFKEVVELFHNESFDVSSLISHTFSIDDVEEALQLMEQAPPDVRKVILTL
ncbi:MAG: zinc-binding dehydrogenase, partial [Anaerobacillus sp.]